MILNSPPASQHFDTATLEAAVHQRFGSSLSVSNEIEPNVCTFLVRQLDVLPALAQFLFWDAHCLFRGLFVEEFRTNWLVRYLFIVPESGWIQILVTIPVETRSLPSIAPQVHAADWYEREAEDMFGIEFEGHPRLGDFILHDQIWEEHIAPMRRQFDPRSTQAEKFNQQWRPILVVEDPGAFAMPVGPIYEGGISEPVHFLLETVGEDVVRAVPRLFYNYRAVEKLAEGKAVLDVLLLAERFCAKAAFAHSLAYCQAVECAAGAEIPARASQLRVALSELERLRHHAGAIEGICQSTALSVSEAHAAIVEEELLRASCSFTGHRYLFGLNTPGGLRRDFDDQLCRELLHSIDAASAQLRRLDERLRYSSSFLDRLEDVGVVSREKARDLGLVGPVGRGSGSQYDMRRVCPYSGYEKYDFRVASEQEGDGYARLRVLFSEAQQSVRLIHQVLECLEPGLISAEVEEPHAAVAFGWVEAPIGAAVHWIRVDEQGRVERYHILSPSFRNWLGFHVAVEDFAFQDFPIILATFALSATECDR